MPASEYYIGLPGDVNIGITSDRELELTQKEALLLGAYLPEARVLDVPPDELATVIHHTESTDRSLSVGKQEIAIHDSWERTFPDDLPHLLYSVARTLWLERGYFPTHAVCVGDNDFVLLPGHSGVGKTTTALRAVAAHGQKVVSGNTTLISFAEDGVMQAVAGTKTMTLRTDDFAQGQFETSQSVAYGNRTAFELDEDTQAPVPQTIGRIALVRLSGGANAWSELSPLSALHTLYPYFLDTEYADCVVAQGNAVYLGGTPEDSRLRLAEYLRRSLADIPVSSGIGDADFLAQKVAGV